MFICVSDSLISNLWELVQYIAWAGDHNTKRQQQCDPHKCDQICILGVIVDTGVWSLLPTRLYYPTLRLNIEPVSTITTVINHLPQDSTARLLLKRNLWVNKEDLRPLMKLRRRTFTGHNPHGRRGGDQFQNQNLVKLKQQINISIHTTWLGIRHIM